MHHASSCILTHTLTTNEVPCGVPRDPPNTYAWQHSQTEQQISVYLQFSCQCSGREWGRGTGDPTPAMLLLTCALAEHVPERALCNWIWRWRSPRPCPAARWLMREFSSIHTRAGKLVGFVAIVWVFTPRPLSFGTWCWRKLWAHPSGFGAPQLLFLQEDFIPLIHLHSAAAEAAAQHSGMRWLHTKALTGHGFMFRPSLTFWTE